MSSINLELNDSFSSGTQGVGFVGRGAAKRSSDRSGAQLNRDTTSQEDLSNNSETYSHLIREANSLMQKHSEQPEFLLQLFQHAAKITRNTDQHVALELLRELSNQRQQSNIQHNR